MLLRLSQRLLTLLQLTRMALVFTAIADGLCTLMLSAHREAARAGATAGSVPILPRLDPRHVLALACVSVGLYGFGMSLNDIIDRRRDRHVAPGRPLPSGRIGVVGAHVVCVGLALLALVAGAYYAGLTLDARSRDWMGFVLVVWTAMLIAFYDLAGKYLVAPGLLTLGLIRFFHALVADANVPLLWHPLLLLNHVAVLSLVAYIWEEKRPGLTPIHWWAVLGGLVVIDALAIVLLAQRVGWSFTRDRLEVNAGLAVPAVAVATFILIAWRVRLASPSSREAGQKVMLYGLLWLIVYDAAFVAGYTRDPLATACVLALLPLAYFSVQLMRWWSKLIALSQPPAFKRART